jgi:hypothetical protein
MKHHHECSLVWICIHLVQSGTALPPTIIAVPAKQELPYQLQEQLPQLHEQLYQLQELIYQLQK